ncbi:MAG: hypothetical protein GKS02_11360 [Alphaproteobacteria bacterium]|nr:hypothetical protein [Alphaproteobacteria bacterium]
MSMSKIRAERVTAIGMIVVAGFFITQSQNLPSTSGAFPKFTEFMIIALAGIMILRTFITRDEKLSGDVRFDFSYMGFKPTLVMIVAAFYIYAVFQVGFYASSIVFYFLVTYMTGIRNYKVMAIVASVLFPLMYVFFNIALGADLPKGILI